MLLLVEISLFISATEILPIKEGEEKSEDILDNAQEWVKNHQQKYDNWLETARQATN